MTPRRDLLQVLDDVGVAVPKGIGIAQLVKLTCRELELTPADIPDEAKACETIKRQLSNVATITQGIAKLRKVYRTGHGKKAGSRLLTSRHAKLAVGAAASLAVFLAEVHQAKLRRS
jgi:hypothetical protein